MPVKTVIGHFSKSEFLSVLPPGFYIFMVLYSNYVIDCSVGSSQQSLFTIIIYLSDQINSRFSLLLFILFASYLLGSICRALPVRWAERTIPPFNSDFPYPEKLKQTFTILKNYSYSKKFKDTAVNFGEKEKPVLFMDVFNYWKDFICLVTPEGFEFYQTFETRSRLFSGIIWSAWFGILGGLYLIIRTWNCAHGVGLPLLFLSIVLLITFGANFRRVRAQEAKALLMIYLAYFHKEHTSSKHMQARVGEKCQQEV